MDLSISIANTNNRALLADCLTSVYALAGDLDIEVFVVDNASNDGSADYVAAHFPQVNLIRNQTRHGFTYNHNMALQQAGGRYLMILNEDTILLPQPPELVHETLRRTDYDHPILDSELGLRYAAAEEGALRELIRVADSDRSIGAIGPRIFWPSGQVQLECAGQFPHWWTDLFHHLGLDKRWPSSKLFGYRLMSYWDHRTSRNVQTLSGCCMMVRRETVEQVGLLDERFFIYAEDVDWCKRLQDAGWTLRYCAEAQIVHFGHQSTQSLPWVVEAAVSRYRYYLKHYGMVQALVFRAVVVPVIAARLFGGALSASRRKRFSVKERLGSIAHLAMLRSMVAP